MTAKIILKPPAYAPGSGVTELLKDMVRTAVSDTITLSTTLTTTPIFTVPANTMVLGAVLETVTTITGGSSDVTMAIGDTTLAGSLGTIEISTATATFASGGLAKNYTAETDLIATFTTGADNTGAFKVWITFKTDSNVQNIGR